MSPSPRTSPTGPPPQRLRLRLNPAFGADVLDGGWWPRSRDLVVELADLVDHFPADRGRLVRAVVSPPDWERTPARVPTARGYVRSGGDRHDDTHVIQMHTSQRAILTLLVVPPAYTDSQGEEALLAAATAGNRTSARSVLRHVLDADEPDGGGQWHDTGTAWWSDGGSVAPSYRRDADR